MVDLANIREQAYAQIYALVNTNKISGSTVTNSFPTKNPSFPCYVLPLSKVTTGQALTYDGSKYQYNVVAEFEVYALQGQGQVKVAQMLDNLQATFEGNSLASNNLLFERLEDDDIDKIEVNNSKLFMSSATVTFTYVV